MEALRGELAFVVRRVLGLLSGASSSSSSRPSLFRGHRRVLKIPLRAGAGLHTGDADRHDDTWIPGGLPPNTDAWALVDAIRKVGGWPHDVRRRRATVARVVKKATTRTALPDAINLEIASFVEPPGGYEKHMSHQEDAEARSRAARAQRRGRPRRRRRRAQRSSRREGTPPGGSGHTMGRPALRLEAQRGGRRAIRKGSRDQVVSSRMSATPARTQRPAGLLVRRLAQKTKVGPRCSVM